MMYLEHFRLTEMPYSLTPNTTLYCSLPPHEEALETLLMALQSGEGVLKVVGEVGTGKTLLCRKLLNELPEHIQPAYIPNPYLQPDELRWALAHELGLQLDSDTNQLQLTQAIQQRLVELHDQGKQVVLLLDEAQAIPAEGLEALRLFTNLETERRKLLQLVLFGQPELDQRLADKSLRQLRQRISFSCQLRPLHRHETGPYIHHRMLAAGYRGAPVFGSLAARMIYRASRGIPRLVNLICHKTLLLCYGKGSHQASVAMVWQAIRDTEDASLLLPRYGGQS
ncbi:general secretion pathway protein GspA [Neiella marina]|uniref:General secretion pathway protein GspA n=1 Tax=Neiella marina TaxID=508461 RepID=A0A8J2U700_9GAMM|nr:general secretion pathway protein GspA [Neiella marina]